MRKVVLKKRDFIVEFPLNVKPQIILDYVLNGYEIIEYREEESYEHFKS